MLEQAFLLTFELGIGGGVRLERLVQVLALADVDGPVLHVLLGLLAALTLGGVGGDVRHEGDHLGVQVDVHEEVIQRADRVVEGALTVRDRDDRRHRRLGLAQGVGDRRALGDLVRRRRGGHGTQHTRQRHETQGGTQPEARFHVGILAGCSVMSFGMDNHRAVGGPAPRPDRARPLSRCRGPG